MLGRAAIRSPTGLCTSSAGQSLSTGRSWPCCLSMRAGGGAPAQRSARWQAGSALVTSGQIRAGGQGDRPPGCGTAHAASHRCYAGDPRRGGRESRAADDRCDDPGCLRPPVGSRAGRRGRAHRPADRRFLTGTVPVPSVYDWACCRSCERGREPGSLRGRPVGWPLACFWARRDRSGVDAGGCQEGHTVPADPDLGAGLDEGGRAAR
mgnify:CR=1 FL=1